MFYGEPGAKKTWALLSLAVCVALGKTWMGFAVKPRKVLIIDEESGDEWLTNRLEAAIQGELGDDSIPVEFVSLAGWKLDKKEDAAELEKLITEHQAGLVIIDALTDIMDGDENSKQDTQPIFTRLKKIASRTNAAIIIIHHSNKAGGYRGSSAIKGALDLLVKIESDEGSKWISFKSEKTRNIEATKFTAVAHWTDDQFFLELADVTEMLKPRNPGQRHVLEYLEKSGEPASVKELMEHAEICSPDQARNAVYKLADEGLIRRTNAGGKNNEAIYDLVNRPVENV